MKRPPLWMALTAVLIGRGFSACFAGDSLPSVDSVLTKWEKASQACRILDAKLIVYEYDPVFADPQRSKTLQGRFYYEAPNIARLEIREGGAGKVNDWPALRSVLIWNGKETLEALKAERCCI